MAAEAEECKHASDMKASALFHQRASSNCLLGVLCWRLNGTFAAKTARKLQKINKARPAKLQDKRGQRQVRKVKSIM